MRNKADLENQVVVVTGSAGGLGEAHCRQLGKMGAKVAALDKDKNNLKTMQNSLTEERLVCKTYVCDVNDPDACFKTIESVISKLGEIPVLVNNAQLSWDVCHSDPLMFEKIMMDANRYVLEQ